MSSWLLTESEWIVIGVSLYCITTVMSLVDYKTGSLIEKIMPFTFLAGVLALTVAIALRWHQLGQGPFMTLYEVLLSNLFSLGLIALIVYTYSPVMRHGARTVLVFLSLLGVWLIYTSPAPVSLPPSFDNPWLWVHVISGKLFLGTCLVAVGLGIQLLVKKMLGKINVAKTANLVQQDIGLWRFMAVAFVFHSAMLLSGAVWARTAWGRYWSWDPLETWALITWLVLAAILHLRLTVKMPLWAGWMLVQIVFVLAFLTFFGMPFLSIAPHKGII